LKSTAENQFLVADFKSKGAAGPELGIHPPKSFFLVGLQVVGCSGPGTRNPPLKIFFLGRTMSYKVHQAWDSKSTAENEILVADFKSRAAVGLELEICHRKSFFLGQTMSYRLHRPWNSKSTPENQFLVGDFKSKGAASPELESHPRK